MAIYIYTIRPPGSPSAGKALFSPRVRPLPWCMTLNKKRRFPKALGMRKYGVKMKSNILSFEMHKRISLGPCEDPNNQAKPPGTFPSKYGTPRLPARGKIRPLAILHIIQTCMSLNLHTIQACMHTLGCFMTVLPFVHLKITRFSLRKNDWRVFTLGPWIYQTYEGFPKKGGGHWTA